MAPMKRFVLCSLFVAIIFLMAFTPIGFIPLGFMRATIIHIPVILGSILLGPKIGAGLGAAFGLTSFIINTTTPVLTSFVFSPLIPIPGTTSGHPAALIVCFLPRILVGVVPYYVYVLLQKMFYNKDQWNWLSLTVAGVIGSLTNTVFVLGSIFLLFRDAWAMARGIASDVVFYTLVGIVTTNGIPEAIVAGIIVTAVGRALLKAVPALRYLVEDH